MKLEYSKNGDYFIPEIALSEQTTKPLGKYGRLRRTYLQEHRKAMYNHLVLSEKLFPHLNEVDELAQHLLDTKIPPMANRRHYRTAQSHRPNEVGRLDEYRKSTGGGNYFCGADLQLIL